MQHRVALSVAGRTTDHFPSTKVGLNYMHLDLAEVIAPQADSLDKNRTGDDRAKLQNQTGRGWPKCHAAGRFRFAGRIPHSSDCGAATAAAPRPNQEYVSGQARCDQQSLFWPGRGPLHVIAYDYTVLTGTEGQMGGNKLRRMLTLAREWWMPMVFYVDVSGRPRPGDTDRLVMTVFDGSSMVRIAVVSGYCFSDSAAMPRCCDVAIVAKNTSIDVREPTAIEHGGLGVYHPAEVGPILFQSPNGDRATSIPTAGPYRVPRRSRSIGIAKTRRRIVPRVRPVPMRRIAQSQAPAQQCL